MDETYEVPMPEEAEIESLLEGEGPDETEPEQPLETTAEQEQPSQEAAADAQEQKGGEAQADQPAAETFTLKHLDETRQVSREEVVTLAQKGMDYDRIRAERDQLRQYREESDPALNMVKSFAQRNGMNLGEYVDYCRKQELMAQGVNEQTANAQIAVEKSRAAMEAAQKETETQRQQQEAEERAAREKAEARDRDMADFLEKYPQVKAADVPAEVWEKVAAGESMVGAYTMYRNKQLEAELAAERQNRRNSASTTGSRAASGTESAGNIFDRAWEEAE